jgi:hypothetical protein
MSALLADLASDCYREETYVRFAVKCAMPRSVRLKQAAFAAGVSVETFVQRHFDTLLSVADAPALAPKLADLITPSRIQSLAIAACLSPATARLALALAAHAVDGCVMMTRKEMANAAEMDLGGVERSLPALIDARLVVRIAPGTGISATRYLIDMERVVG